MFKDAPLDAQKSFEMPKGLDADGVIKVGVKLRKFVPVLVLYETSKKDFKTFFNKESESCSVEGIVISSGENNNTEKVSIKLKFDRRPVLEINFHQDTDKKVSFQCFGLK